MLERARYSYSEVTFLQYVHGLSKRWRLAGFTCPSRLILQSLGPFPNDDVLALGPQLIKEISQNRLLHMVLIQDRVSLSLLPDPMMIKIVDGNGQCIGDVREHMHQVRGEPGAMFWAVRDLIKQLDYSYVLVSRDHSIRGKGGIIVAHLKDSAYYQLRTGTIA